MYQMPYITVCIFFTQVMMANKLQSLGVNFKADLEDD
jgi:hypothetical protein